MARKERQAAQKPVSESRALIIIDFKDIFIDKRMSVFIEEGPAHLIPSGSCRKIWKFISPKYGPIFRHRHGFKY